MIPVVNTVISVRFEGFSGINNLFVSGVKGFLNIFMEFYVLFLLSNINTQSFEICTYVLRHLLYIYLVHVK